MNEPSAKIPTARAAIRPQRMRLGDVLIEQKLITLEQLRVALETQTRRGRRLGRLLVELGFVTEDQVVQALARQLNLRYVDLAQFNFNPSVVHKLPESAARRFRAVPLEERGNTIVVGMADPTDLFAFDELTRLLKRDAQALALRLKLMAGLDISEKRLPQDGRFNVAVRQNVVDVRMSTMPTAHGESVVMRLLNRESGLLGVENLGMPQGMTERFRAIINRVSGMVLVTGPTGSGKTTTLYAALNELNSPTRKIITVEDPVEYRVRGLNQVQVNEKIDLTFATVLRSVLRQDPDVILVGEVRDTETAQIGLRAAITGHMVLSTLHVREAASVPVRLLDMAVPRYMVATALQAVIAQRLVRLICERCTKPHVPTAQEERFLELEWPGQTGEFKQGAGCNRCNGSGYRGRLGVYEMLEMTPRLVEAVAKEDMTAFMRAAGEEMAGRSFVQHAAALAASGRTTLAEAMRISQAEE